MMPPAAWRSTFTLTVEVNRCCQFAEQVSQSVRQFGTEEEWGHEQALADCLIGKVCEVAFQKFIASNLDIRIVLDFEFYEGIDRGSDVRLITAPDGSYCIPS